MTVSGSLISLLVCCISVCMVIRAAERNGILEIKSNSPNAHVEAVFRSRAQRLRREASGSRLTEEERQDFLTAHNNYRKAVDPPAANMEEMVWDDGLASMAQEWADNCTLKRGQPKRDNLPYSDIGQNIFTITQSASVASVATTAWYNRMIYYSFEGNHCDPIEDCDPYTQVVWADSSHLGCAIADCPDPASWGYSRFCVCYYAPAGNADGRRPYTKGETCSACPNNTICQSKLCARCIRDFCVNDNNEGSEGDNNGGAEDENSLAREDDNNEREKKQRSPIISWEDIIIVELKSVVDNNDEGIESDKNEGGEGNNNKAGEGKNNEDGEGDNNEGDEGDNDEGSEGDNDEGSESDSNEGGEDDNDEGGEGNNDEGSEGDNDEGGESDNNEGGESDSSEGGEGIRSVEGTTAEYLNTTADNGDDNDDGCDDNCFFCCPRQAGYVATPIRWFYPVVSILLLSNSF